MAELSYKQSHTCMTMFLIITLGVTTMVAGQNAYMGDLFNSVFQSESNSSMNSQLQALDSLSRFDLSKLISNLGSDESMNGAIQGFVETALIQQGIHKDCAEDLQLVLDSMLTNDTWIYQMLDSIGKPPSNLLLTFNLNWIGSYTECKNIQAVRHSPSGNPSPGFQGKYCRINIPLPASIRDLVKSAIEALQVQAEIQLGVCVPDSCYAEDIKRLMETVGRLAFNASEDYTASGFCEEDQEISTGTIVAICILSCLGLFLVTGTLYDVIAIQMKEEEKEYKADKQATRMSAYTDKRTAINGDLVKIEPIPGITSNGLTSQAEKEKTEDTAVNNGMYLVTFPPEGKAEKGDLVKIEPYVEESVKTENSGAYLVTFPSQKNAKPEKTMAEKILLSFSMYTNGVKLLNTSQASGSLGSINGIRFLSMGWVIFGHTSYTFLRVDDNMGPYVYRKMDDWTFAGILQGSVSVDTFFALSGLLVAYLTLKGLKKLGGPRKMNWFMFYFHRYLRLTPAYMLVVMVMVTIFPLLSFGPLWPMAEMIDVKNCKDSWWTNVLYVNNYVGSEREMCLPWSWYLANDMQFYWISPLIIIPFYYNAVFGGVIAFLLITASTVARGFIAKEHEYTAIFEAVVGPQPKDRDFYHYLYMKAHTRIGPYIVGLVAGYIIYRCKRIYKLNKMVNLTGWLTCFATVVLIIYGTWHDHGRHYLTVNESSVYVALHRSAWGMAVCWIVFACSTGNGGWINEVLSWKGFVPLTRMTYCAYLIHPIVCNLYYLSRERLLHFSDYEVAYLFVGNLVFSYAAAFLTSLAFESPMMGVEKAVFGRDKSS